MKEKLGAEICAAVVVPLVVVPPSHGPYSYSVARPGYRYGYERYTCYGYERYTYLPKGYTVSHRKSIPTYLTTSYPRYHTPPTRAVQLSSKEAIGTLSIEL